MRISTAGRAAPNGPAPVVLAADKPVSGESPARRAMNRFRRHRLAMISLTILTIIVILSVGAPLWQGYPPNTMNLAMSSKPPSATHVLGTDRIGRDVWSRLINGGRVSLMIGLSATLISLTFGIVLGAVSGYFGGWVDIILQRFTDIVMTFPSIVLMLTLAVFVGPGLLNTTLIIGGVSWPGLARLVRAEYLSARERTYVEAARCVGVRSLRIMFTHILPNALAPVLAAAAFGIGSAILTEAGLSFLGLGVPLPTSSWGNMLETAREIQVLSGAPWMWMPPALMIVLTVLCVNFIGDGLRDAFDPRTLL
ncbi:MAG: ABC transporter permease [Chloroflexi bacterium]|nr:ABC transporter permease [Chloroflexota bacterium]